MIRDTQGQDIQLAATKSYRKYWLGAACVTLVAALAAYSLSASNGDTQLSLSRDSVKTAAVVRGDLVRDIATTGFIVAANAPQIYSPSKGYVQLLVNPGDEVAKNQTIAKVHSPELTNELKQQESELQRLSDELSRKELQIRRDKLALAQTLDMATVTLNAAEREHRRALLSIKDNLISQIDMEQAQDDLARAKLAYKHAQQEVEIGKDTLAFELKSAQGDVTRQQLVVDELNRRVNELQIVAPVAGVVGNWLVQQQAAVSPSEALMTLVDLSAFEAELQVPESYANELGLGLEVELKIADNRVVGTLSSISPEVKERQVSARVRFDQSQFDKIRQNQRLSARILLENRENVLMVRRGAFMNEGGLIAYRVNGDVAERIQIQTGATSVANVELTAGVAEGDTLVVSNYDSFKQAERVLLR
ncbi:MULTISPECIES: HlyD family efflux transporter periplasmic adaptor subunit [unclassified Pseudoalteromonas]|uniref:efflux RND transporter periplasmic adaptor subunit n=1 Tax=unclassified Pseudoalteromonas TaxID=194690 RepID=UPI000CF69063|nr:MULTISPECIES: HlyD family efflux transporter periplasmic adaptor subunit [unclassified Pseudoalteromonas]MBS3796335.1 efflux RND transporter periplasmic adaptor subunit [Pseudoalteromonas sp. BDTF-M6]